MTSKLALGAVLLLALVACGGEGDKAEGLKRELFVRTVQTPQGAVTCIVYDSDHDQGSGIDCGFPE